MVVLAGTLVLSVDTVAPSVQFPDNAVTKTALSKAQSRQSFFLLCILHTLELFPFNLPVCHLPYPRICVTLNHYSLQYFLSLVFVTTLKS